MANIMVTMLLFDNRGKTKTHLKYDRNFLSRRGLYYYTYYHSNTEMADTDDWRKPTTVYRLAYRRKPSTKRGAGDRGPPSSAVALLERMSADRKVIDSPVPPDIAIALRAETAISTYTRDYPPPSRVAAVADTSSRRRPPSTGHAATARPAACERPVAAPRTNVTYTGPAPPESYVPPRTEYWWTHGQLAGRAIADGAVPKRIKRCQRINPTRIF